MYHVEKFALPLMLGSLLDSFAETLQVIRRSRCPPEMIELGETGTPVSSEPLPLQSEVEIPKIFPRFEDHHVLVASEVQNIKAVTGETI